MKIMQTPHAVKSTPISFRTWPLLNEKVTEQNNSLFSTNIRLAKSRYFFVRNCWDYSRFGTYIALIRNDISCALSDRINRYSIQRTSIVRTLPAQTRLTARRFSRATVSRYAVFHYHRIRSVKIIYAQHNGHARRSRGGAASPRHNSARRITPRTAVCRGAVRVLVVHRKIAATRIKLSRSLRREWRVGAA